MAKRTKDGDTAPADSPDSGGAGGQILVEYLTELKGIHDMGGGVAETSYYPALANLFNAIGKTVKPKVRCVMNLKDLGGGMPDGGLFTADQIQSQADGAPKIDQLPARGAIEAKGAKPEAADIAKTAQVIGYLNTYGIVLVTNLRQFLIVERGSNGRPEEREAFSLADDEKDFWKHKVAHPVATARQKGDQFAEFIKRACLHAAPLTNPKDVAWFLASYARDALYRVEQQKELPALQAIRSALEAALGMKFTGEKGEHFFRSTLVQTLFYGVFSAWVFWHKKNPAQTEKFDWKAAEWSLHVPFVRVLYEEIAKPSRLGPLGMVEVLDWSTGVLNRVDREEFFRGFEDDRAIQYFYEPFLEAYDPKLRKELGVWYTPPEIVKYQVARVDKVLREELDLPDGLADPKVIVLDPCCGTGAYLVEVLHSIAATLREKGGDALVASDLKQAAMKRIFGFEIMSAPFVVSHLQLNLLLQAQGAPLLQQTGERVGVYLTNAITGWRPLEGAKATAPFQQFAELLEERDAAEHVKRDKKILVVVGNPPYNAFAGVSPEEEQGLVEVYKGAYKVVVKNKRGKVIIDRKTGQPKEAVRYTLNDPVSMAGWGIKKFNLDELYVRFFRLAERRIAEMSGMGVVSFISNFSYLGEPSFVVMRQRFLAEFDTLWLDCLNGDSRETGKLTPDGKPDPSVFSTDYNREGIRVGTAVCVIVRKPARQNKPTVRFRHLWGASKRADLLDSLNSESFDAAYTLADPRSENRFSFRPEIVSDAFRQWASISDLSEFPPTLGILDNRKEALIKIDREEVEHRAAAYLNPEIDWDEISTIVPELARNYARFNAKPARVKAIIKGPFNSGGVRRVLMRPMDIRWCYYTPVRPVWTETRPKLVAQCWQGNQFLMTRRKSASSSEGAPMAFTSVLGMQHALQTDAYYVPLQIRTVSKDGNGLFGSSQPHANLSKAARAYVAKLGIEDPDGDAKTAGLIWMHALAVGYSPAYVIENGDGIRRDWPRIPLPDTLTLLEASARLGEEIASLLDIETEAPGVTVGKIAPILKGIGLISKTGGGQLDTGGDLTITAGWGNYGRRGEVMPSHGNLTEREYEKSELKVIDAETTALGVSTDHICRLLGNGTCDVFLNDAAYWRNVPLNVWHYTIGGFQVLRKWLSYRDNNILGRALKPEEAREFMNTARRVAAIILLQPKLDKNYSTVKAAAYAWPSK